MIDDGRVAQPHTTLRWNPAGTSLLLARIPMLRVGETGQLFMHWGDQQAYFRERDDGLDPGLSSFSVSFWFKSKSSSDFYYVVHKGSELGGLEPGLNHGGDVDSFRRFIYIHGTPDDQPMGEPASHGCIRMRNTDVIALFARVPVATPVTLVE